MKTVNVRSLREKLGWTQNQLATWLGVNPNSVAKMESGKYPFGAQTARQLVTLSVLADRPALLKRTMTA